MLVSFIRSDRDGRMHPGDAVIAGHWPVDETEIEWLRSAVKAIVEPGALPAERVVILNIVRLGRPT